MTHYRGITNKDQIIGGGSYDPKEKHDAYNFLAINGICYGYVEPPRHTKITLHRIDNTCPLDREILKDVLVVWVSSRPNVKGTYIVGWYKHATVYSNFQKSKEGARKCYSYNIKASANNCTLLPIDKRTFNVPRGNRAGKGFLGQFNVWYADAHIPAVNRFKNKVLDYINNYKADKISNSIRKIIEANAEQRKAVEKAAVDHVKKEYQSRGYTVTSREKENCGWDLDAVRDYVSLKLEVKGLGGEGMVHISSNEYKHMRQDKKNYRLCVVFNAIRKPELIVFLWDPAIKAWVAEIDSSIVLEVETKESYIARVKSADK